MYPCDQCEYIATQLSSLNRHTKRKHSVDRSGSSIVESEFEKESAHEEVRYTCDQCEFSSAHSHSLKRHKGSKHERIRYPCDQCEYAATQYDDLKNHKRSKHEGIRYPCKHCEYIGSDQSNLNNHKKSKHEGIIYPCDECEYIASEQSNLNKHKKVKHEGIRFQCDQCPFTGSSSGLWIHKKSKHEGIMYPCDQCEYIATQLSSLKRHTKRKHGVECPVAIKKEFRPQIIETGLIEAPNISDKGTEVAKEENINGSVHDSKRDEENITTADQLQHDLVNMEHFSALISSTKQKQSHREVYSCDQCEFTGSKSGLKYHRESVHEGVRYPCDQCEYVATQLSSLKRHTKRKHSGECSKKNRPRIMQTVFIEASNISDKGTDMEEEDITDDPLSITNSAGSIIVQNEYENIIITPNIFEMKQEPI